ncbi:MAG: hypothetical protein E7656_10065 [Ruminococcaceae bacterium]|nr:hypothetical protein [Oscillospiraceae bacterium]
MLSLYFIFCGIGIVPITIIIAVTLVIFSLLCAFKKTRIMITITIVISVLHVITFASALASGSNDFIMPLVVIIPTFETSVPFLAAHLARLYIKEHSTPPAK